MKHMNLVYSLGLTTILGAALSGCGTQPPVEVVDGFGNSGANSKISKSYTGDNFALNVVETSTPEPFKPEQDKTYTVQEGDKLSQIAAFFSVDEDELLKKNKLITAEQIHPDMELKIPSFGEDASNKAVSVSVDDMLDADIAAEQAEDKAANYRLTDQYKAKTAVTASVKAIPMPQHILKHTVAAGENIYRIGLQYGVSQFDIINANDGVDPSDLKIGQKIIIPMKREGTAPSTVAVPVETEIAENVPAVQPKAKPVSKVLSKADYEKIVSAAPKVSVSSKGMMWPARGELLKTYGTQELGVSHSGINIVLKDLTPIRAAEGGKVIYSDNGLEQYGNLILIRHNNGYVTAYAHNAYNHVQRNQWVKKGAVIALAGQTGLVDRTQLHFEVRKNAQAINPLSVLPK